MDAQFLVFTESCSDYFTFVNKLEFKPRITAGAANNSQDLLGDVLGLFK